VVERWFSTPIRVAACRRAPFATISSGGQADLPRRRESATTSADQILLPRCDEHTLGQLLEGLRLAAAVESGLD
jgi:hypothetical protein